MEKISSHWGENRVAAFVCICIASLCSTTSVLGFSGAPPIQKPVKWSEIHEKNSIGSQWVIGKGKDNQELALYDRSFLFPTDFIELGSLDLDLADFATIKGLIFDESQVQNYSKEQIEALDPIRKLLDLEQEKLKLKSSKSPLPDNWWKSVPWKSGKMSRAMSETNDAPLIFNLTDFDLARLAPDFEKVKRKMDSLVGPGFLEGFLFIKKENGGYLFGWNPNVQSDLDRPWKVADLRCAQCEMIQRLVQEGLLQGLNQLIGQIPIPAVSALFSVAVGQWIHFYNEKIRIHEEELFEMMMEAEDQSVLMRSSPFYPYSNGTRQKAAASVYYAQSSLLTFWQWIVRTPGEAWSTDKWRAQNRAKDSIRYLESQGYDLELLNPRFAVARKDSQRWIYLLSAPRYWNVLPPFIAIDDQRPHKIFLERSAVEGAHILVQYLSSFVPVPVVGGILSQIFELGIHSQMHRIQHWDARLGAHLRFRQQQFLNENWEDELRLLQFQTVNPWFFPWQGRLDQEKNRSESN